MHPKDVKLSRLTNNLMTLSQEVAQYSAAESLRYATGVDEARKAALKSAQGEPKTKKRGRAAVVSWDLGHNPAGRAYVLYELLKKDWNVDLIGPMWSRYGTGIWAPLRNSDLRIRSFHCANVSEFVPKAEAIAAGQHYDIVYVCKPRLPSLYLGALIKEASDCPMIVDVDDFELSFFKNEEFASVDDLKADIHAALHEPFEELATRYSQTLVSSADAVTVSNPTLRRRFGGHIVRHARDEAEFKNSSERREAARQKLGIAGDEFALMFIGTPRLHKGVLSVARALHELNDPNMVFHIVGSITDKKLKEDIEAFDKARVIQHPNCAFEELPELLAGADLVPLLQDTSHAISQFQIPAKISDALSLGVPVVASNVPPLRDLIASGAIHEACPETLKEVIVSIKNNYDEKAGNSNGLQERRNFLSEFGMSVNRLRLNQAIEEAVASRLASIDDPDTVVSLFSSKTASVSGGHLPHAIAEMVDTMRSHYKGLRGDVLRIAAQRRGEQRNAPVKSAAVSTFKKFPAFIRSRSVSYDFAYFWKQNDSNMYGRRSDMIAKGLVNSGRVRKMLHLDAPISILALNEHIDRGIAVRNDQQDMIVRALIDRQMGVYDSEIVRNRTHVFSRQAKAARFLGKSVLQPDAYIRFVNEQLEEHGMRAKNTVAWFCPVIPHARELITNIGFGGVVCDLIDDQRAWDSTPQVKNRLNASYRDTLSVADVVFANCDSLAEAMQGYATDPIHVVPNGAERFNDYPQAPVPDALKNIKGPIVGYVGNLRDRIDWTLLHEVVPAMPDVSFVFFGPSSDNPNADSLAKYENVHVPGVVAYDDLAFHLKAFDVGIVPHLDNQLTARMNPLKVYNYFAAGIPIVSSEVANLENLGSVLRTATTADEFVSGIRHAIANKVDTNTDQWRSTMDTIAWENRVKMILDTMDQSLHRKLRKSA